MYADWMASSKLQNLIKVFKYYDKNRNLLKLHYKTRIVIEKLLEKEKI